MSFHEAEQISLIKDVHVEFHSYFTICTKTELALERILCRGFDMFSMAPYSRTMFTIYDLRASR